MDITFQLLLLTHILALVVGTATAVAMPVVMGRMAAASPEGKQMLGGIGQRLGKNSQISFGVLLLTGIAMVVVRYGGVDGMNGWFWAKMAFIVVVLAMMLVGVLTKPGTINPRLQMWVARLALIGIIVSAVFAFN
jgi:protoporphyrinogen IX oxidase